MKEEISKNGGYIIMCRRVLCYAPGWYVTVDGRKIKGPYMSIIRCELEAQQIEQHNPGSYIDVEYVEKEKKLI